MSDNPGKVGPSTSLVRDYRSPTQTEDVNGRAFPNTHTHQEIELDSSLSGMEWLVVAVGVVGLIRSVSLTW